MAARLAARRALSKLAWCEAAASLMTLRQLVSKVVRCFFSAASTRVPSLAARFLPLLGVGS